VSTQAQVLANQSNAQKSTGPVTETGKAKSSINRRDHGLGGKFTVLPCENQEEYDALLGNLDMEFQPGTPTEVLLIEQMAESRFTRDRALRLQQGTLDPNTGEIADEKKFSLYQRYFTAHNNAFHKALNELLKLRKIKHDLRIGFEREKRAKDSLPFLLGIKDCLIIDKESKRGELNRPARDARQAIVDQLFAERAQAAA
jgi:hypothetical protein